MELMDGVRKHFDEEAACFDETIIKLIPYYREMVTALIELIPFGINDEIRVLDLGCGTGTVSHAIKEKFPNAAFTLVDLAPKMLDIAKRKIGDPQTIIHNADFYNYQMVGTYDVVVSSLALHHLVTDDDKKRFYGEIFKALNAGGVFFNADVVLGSNTRIQEVYMRKWVEYMARSCPESEIREKWIPTYEKEDRPARLLDQVQWLHELGFRDVDVIWKYFNFAVYGGYR